MLGPVLFTLYNSPINAISVKHGVSDHFYADDEQIYVSFPLAPDHSAQARAYSMVSNCVGETKSWMSDNLIQFNDQKSDALVCYSKSSRLKPANIPLALGEASISPSDTVRNLGVTLDTHLTMQKHIEKVCSTAFYHLRKIAKIRKHISRAATAQLVSALVLSHINYGNSLLTGLPACRIYPLQKVKNAAARVVTGARRRDHTSRHLKDLHWLPVSYRIDFKIAVLTWRCLNGCAPSYLSSLLHRRNLGGRTLRSSSASSAHTDLAPPSVHINPTANDHFPTMLLLCGTICLVSSVLVPPSKDFVRHLRPTCFVKPSMPDFPVSIESFYQRP